MTVSKNGTNLFCSLHNHRCAHYTHIKRLFSTKRIIWEGLRVRTGAVGKVVLATMASPASNSSYRPMIHIVSRESTIETPHPLKLGNRAASIKGSACRARRRTDVLVDMTLGNRTQLIVWGRISEIALVGVEECGAHGLRPACPQTVMLVMRWFG